MSFLDYLAGTARMIRVNLESALVKPALPRTSERVAALELDAGTREGVTAFYQERTQELVQTRKRLSNARAKYNRYAFGLGLALAILLGLTIGIRFLPLWAAALAALPLVPAVISVQKATRCKERAEEATRLLGFYQRRLSRMRQEWMGQGDPGMDLREPDHPSARDLDLFGEGSMFELLCDVDTPAGRETLATWLQHPASLEEITSRQNSIRSLRNRTDLRETLELLRGGEISELSWGMLRDWLTAAPADIPRWAPMSAILLPIALAAAFAFWAITLFHSAVALWLLVAVGLVEGGFALFLGGRVRTILAEVQISAGKVASLRRMCAYVQAAPLDAPALADLQRGFGGSAGYIGGLQRLVARLTYRDNEFTVWFFSLSMGTTRTAFSIERWQRQHGGKLVQWMALLGEFEALMAIATYAYENPDDTFPEFAGDGPLFEANGMGHPLMDAKICVRNDVALEGDKRFLLVTGSNMSGKSTLLRSVGLNATLAQMGAPVRAERLRLSQTQVCASIRVEDSLLDGASHFYAEVQRLNAILELARSGRPVLFLIDELFAGTNSSDCRIAAEAVIGSLATLQAIGLVTSHDLALSEIAEKKQFKGENVHFTDLSTADGSLGFDYRIHPGKLARGNALKIVKLVGLAPES